MRVIDLLNKIAKGEEVPKKIVYTDDDLCRYVFELELDKDYWCEELGNWLFDYWDVQKILNDEIEIIEEVEDKEYEDIEEIEDNHKFYSYSEYELRKHEIDKISYILRGINEATDMAVKNANKINALIRNQKYILGVLDKND